MHTVELLEQALAAVARAGYQVREESLGDAVGGACVLRGKKWFFIDPALDLSDQLELACEVLRTDPQAAVLALSDELRTRVHGRRAA